MAATIFSNAFNFASYRDGQVDLRTGQFSAAIRLATLRPEGAGGGRRDIYLTFSMNQPENTGYGIGWSLNETEANPLPENWEGRRPPTRLKLASGESFPIETWRDDDGFMRFRYKTLKTFFVKALGRDRLDVHHIDGSVETLKLVGPRSTFRTTDLVFENGERFVFEYTARHGRLERIRNTATGTEFLHLTYDDRGSITRSKTRATAGRSAEMEFAFFKESGKQNMLRKIVLPRQSDGGKNDSFPVGAYIYDYVPVGNGCHGISDIGNPMGGWDVISYRTGADSGHAYKNDRVPNVREWVRWPDQRQPHIVRKYRYSGERNFTGTPTAAEHAAGDDDTDFLDQAPDDYTYWCEETLVDAHDEGSTVATTLTTFNKFHLMIEEKTDRQPIGDGKNRGKKSCQVTASITYNQAQPNKDHRPPRRMKDQPHNLRIPKIVTIEYQVLDSGEARPARSERTIITSDDFGNITSRIEPSGIHTEYLYYPIAGEKAADADRPAPCPADPAGLFRRYLKQEKITAAAGQPGRTTRETRFTYVATPRLDDPVRGYFVQRATESTGSGLVTIHDYVVDKGSSGIPAWPTNGRLKETTTTIRDADGGKTRFHYEYHADDHSLRETRTIQGKVRADGEAAPGMTAERRVDLATGLLLELGSHDGTAIHYDYDTVGRLTEEAVMLGTTRQAVRRYRYDYAQRQRESKTILTAARRRVRDAVRSDREYVTAYDGFGRPVSSSETCAGKTRLIRETTYDSRGGRRLSDTVHDWIDEGPAGEPRRLPLTTSYAYDGWNEVSETTRPDGSIALSSRDYVDNTLTTGLKGSSTTVTRYNAFGQAASVTQVSAPGEQRETLELLRCEYDGFGRCISWLDADKRLTRVGYDDFDRIVREVSEPAQGDRRIVTTAYAPHTVAALPASLTVNGTVLGERGFDAFGRVTTDIRTGIGLTRYIYRLDPEDDGDNEGLKPSACISPDGTKLKFSYDPALELVTRITEPGQQSIDYCYDATTGRMTRASNAAADNSFAYDDNLHLKSASVTVKPSSGSRSTTDADTPAVVLTAHSPAGRLCRVSRPGKAGTVEVEKRHYDAAGRLKKIEIPAQGRASDSIEYGYDDQGRITGTTVTLNGARLATAVTFDPLGREATRSFHLNGRKCRSVHLSYGGNGKLSRRETGIHPDGRSSGDGSVSRATTGAAPTLIVVETFAYDGHGRLAAYTCTNQRPSSDGQPVDGGKFPRDSLGRQLLSQSFTYDALDNIVTVETGFVGGSSEKLVRGYNGHAPGQLAEITNPATKHVVRLRYDDNGRLTDDGHGQTFQYDAFGRLSSSSRAGDYQHDALGRLTRQSAATDTGRQTLALDYVNGRLAGEHQGNAALRYLRDDDLVLGHRLNAAGEPQEGEGSAMLYAAGHSGSIVGTAGADGGFADRLYTPYGEFERAGGTDDALSLQGRQIGLNGERFDAAAGLYHLGNGRRAYSPRLMIFLSPDPLSPFDGAGYGLYSYCRGDPANATDPSGLITLPAFNLSPEAGIALGVGEVTLTVGVYVLALIAVVSTGGSGLAVFAAVGAILGVGGALAGLGSAVLARQGDAEGSALLNKVSVGLGLSSLTFGGLSAVGSGIAAARGLTAASRVVTTSARVREGVRQGLSGFVGVGSTPAQTAIGVGAFGVGGFNLYHGGASWLGEIGTGGGVAAGPGRHRQFSVGDQAVASPSATPGVTDAVMQFLLAEEGFSREAARIRDCFGTDLYDDIV